MSSQCPPACLLSQLAECSTPPTRKESVQLLTELNSYCIQRGGRAIAPGPAPQGALFLLFKPLVPPVGSRLALLSPGCTPKALLYLGAAYFVQLLRPTALT